MGHLCQRLILFFTLCAASVVINAQTVSTSSPYRLSWGLDAPLSGGALGLNVTYYVLHKRTPHLDINHIAQLDAQNINPFDRGVTRNWSKPIAKVSDGLLFASMALPSVLLLDRNIRNDFGKVGVIWAQTFTLNVGVTNITKVLAKRTRPYVYNPNAPMDMKLEPDARYSFFSGHTSVTSSMCFMTAKIYHDYNRGSRAVPYVWTAAAVVPAVMGYLRCRAGKHFPTDVIIGYIVGAGIGILVPELHRRL